MSLVVGEDDGDESSDGISMADTESDDDADTRIGVGEAAAAAAGGGRMRRMGKGIMRRGSLFFIHSDDDTDSESEVTAEAVAPESEASAEAAPPKSETKAEAPEAATLHPSEVAKAVKAEAAEENEAAPSAFKNDIEVDSSGRCYDTPGSPTRKTTIGFIQFACSEEDFSAILAAARMRESDPDIALRAIRAFGQLSANADKRRVAELIKTECIGFICESIKRHNISVLEDGCAVLWSVSVLADDGAKSASEFTSNVADASVPVIVHAVTSLLNTSADDVPPSLQWCLGVLCYLAKQLNRAKLKTLSGGGLFAVVCHALIKFGSRDSKVAQWGIGILSCFEATFDPEVLALVKQTSSAHVGVPEVSNMARLVLAPKEHSTLESDVEDALKEREPAPAKKEQKQQQQQQQQQQHLQQHHQPQQRANGIAAA